MHSRPKLETYKLFFEQVPKAEVAQKSPLKQVKALKKKQNLLENPSGL